MREVLFASCLVLLVACFSGNAQVPKLQVALTFDDLPETGVAPADVSRAQIMDSIVATLRAEHMPPVYGFLNADKLEKMPDGPAILRNWMAAGNLLGSHTYSHPDLESTTVPAFEDDIVKNEPALEQYAGGTDWHLFRYPFLHEGETLEKRQAIQTFLAKRGYQVAEVSLDFEDYLWNEPYTRCVAKQRTEQIDALHDSYLIAADQYVDVYRSLARRLYGHDIAYVLLLHVTAMNARMLPDLIAQLRERGFSFITLPEALKDPAYATDPAIGYPGGGPLQELAAVAKKLPFPPAVKPTAWLERICR